ncbi:barstar family protein [Kitasatospora sp. MMS16-BH015]|uniref:barstar family protein n=1 Tax=Kitasatospora sp. MMS16-BH015 TaxID=2018025 RepID=UPI002110BDE8|nr:barstar family protein [Kitasatospora sp. MMS16-BH015]
MAEETRRSSFLLPPPGTSYVAWLDGARMGTEQGLLEETSTRLGLPVYFGWNWDALSDCLRDMAWAPADHYLLVIERSALVLRECTEARQIFLGILDTAGRYWGLGLDHPGKSFNALLL